MPRHSFIQMSKLPNVKGRISYIILIRKILNGVILSLSIPLRPHRSNIRARAGDD